MEEYKAQQVSRLAQLIPMIMNTINGRDPEIARVLGAQRAQEQQRVNQANLDAFMTTVMMPQTGPVTPQLIGKMAEQFKIPQQVAMQEIQKFQQFRQSMQPKQPDPYTLNPGDMRFGGDNKPVAFNPKGSKLPTSAQEFEYSLKNPGYADFIKTKTPSTNINNISIPKGYMMGKDGKSVIPIPGGPEAQKIAEKEKSEKNKKFQAQTELNLANKTVEKALEQSSNWTTGVVGAATSLVPGTPAHNLKQNLNTLKAIGGFRRLQAMRDASPTGGALGQVSERELELLQSAYTSLEQSQSKEQFETNLKQWKQVFNDIVNGPENSDPKQNDPLGIR